MLYTYWFMWVCVYMHKCTRPPFVHKRTPSDSLSVFSMGAPEFVPISSHETRL